MANREGSFLAFLHFGASVSTNTPITIPASFAARALIFASLIDVLVFHKLRPVLAAPVP
jgi:uncharacterized PurR-regulated membrane protein YhhQ (DUF165 family)